MWQIFRNYVRQDVIGHYRKFKKAHPELTLKGQAEEFLKSRNFKDMIDPDQ